MLKTGTQRANERDRKRHSKKGGWLRSGGGEVGGACPDTWVVIGSLERCFPRLEKREGREYAEALDGTAC